MGSIASINFKIAKSNSTAHNERTVELDYNFPDLSRNNESWKIDEIEAREKVIARHCKQVSGRKLQKNAEPIREAVLNIKSGTTMAQLQELANHLKVKKGIDCFQIYIHRDEGKSREELNHHAHMIFDWQDKKTGKTIKLNPQDLSEIQTIVSSSLDMERGELKVNSNRERLEPIEYKRQQEELKVQQLQSQVEDLEQKKNKAAERNRAARAAYEQARANEQARKQARRATISELFRKGSQYDRSFVRIEENDIIQASRRQLDTIAQQQEVIRQLESEYRELQDSLSRAAEEARRIEGSDQHREFKRLKSQIAELEADIRRNKRTLENRKSK